MTRHPVTGEATRSGVQAGAGRPRARRLRSSRDVRAVFATRRAAVSPFAVVHIRDRAQPDQPRFTVVAGRKVGSAVQRNRVKRRLRAILAELPLRGGADYVVVGRRATLRARAPELRATLARQVADVGRS